MAMGALQSTSKNRRADVETKAWALAQRFGTFGYAEIASELTISMEAATKIIRTWEDMGRVCVKHGGNGAGRKRFEITKEHREPADHAGKVAQQLWNGMMGLKSFTPSLLAGHCRPDLGVTREMASDYCQALLRAGYLRVQQLAIPDEREALYLLINKTGMRAPRERRVRAVWDDNAGAYVYIAGAGRIGGAK